MRPCEIDDLVVSACQCSVHIELKMSRLWRCPHDKPNTSLNCRRSNMNTPDLKFLADGARAFRYNRHQRMGATKPMGDVSLNLYGIHRVALEARTISPFPYLPYHVCYSDTYKRVSSRASWRVKGLSKELPRRNRGCKMEGWKPIH